MQTFIGLKKSYIAAVRTHEKTCNHPDLKLRESRWIERREGKTYWRHLFRCKECNMAVAAFDYDSEYPDDIYAPVVHDPENDDWWWQNVES